MDNFSELINQDLSQLDWGDEKKEQVLYTPKFSEGKGDEYVAEIRFVLHPKYPRKPYLHKYTYWLDEEALGIRGFFDSPATVGQPCDIANKYWKYAKSGDAVLEELAKEKLSRKRTIYCFNSSC
jgi:hypothetical protein